MSQKNNLSIFNSVQRNNIVVVVVQVAKHTDELFRFILSLSLSLTRIKPINKDS